MEKLVSIIVNCRNGQDYLKDALQSIFAQKYTNFEIIFFDNCSDDKSLEIAKKYKDPRIKYIQSKKLLKLYEARNAALKHCNGDFIAFLDVDDKWDKDFLSKKINFFNQEEYMFSYTNWNFLYQKKNKTKTSKEKLPSGYIFNELSKNYFIKLSSLIINKKIFSYFPEMFNENYNIIGDFDLCMKISQKFKGFGFNENLVTIRVHRNNYSNLNRQMHYLEYKNWFDNLNIENELIKKNLVYYKEKLLYLNIISLILSKKKINSIKKIFKYPNNLKKIKLIIIFFLPQYLIQKILDR